MICALTTVWAPEEVAGPLSNFLKQYISLCILHEASWLLKSISKLCSDASRCRLSQQNMQGGIYTAHLDLRRPVGPAGHQRNHGRHTSGEGANSTNMGTCPPRHPGTMLKSVYNAMEVKGVDAAPTRHTLLEFTNSQPCLATGQMLRVDSH